MSFWVLTERCQVLSRMTVQRVTNLERQAEDIISPVVVVPLTAMPRQELATLTTMFQMEMGRRAQLNGHTK